MTDALPLPDSSQGGLAVREHRDATGRGTGYILVAAKEAQELLAILRRYNDLEGDLDLRDRAALLRRFLETLTDTNP